MFLYFFVIIDLFLKTSINILKRMKFRIDDLDLIWFI